MRFSWVISMDGLGNSSSAYNAYQRIPSKSGLDGWLVGDGSGMVEITMNNISDFLSSLGFSLKSGEELTYSKNYRKNGNYEIKIRINKSDFKKSVIEYGDGIQKDRGTTCNFYQPENFVVLDVQ